MRLADPGRSRAILVGTAHYEDPSLPDIPQVVANVVDLAAILSAPDLGGFEADSVRTVVDPRRSAVGPEIEEWGRGADDTLVVYFSGHGMVDDKGELLLAMSDTRADFKHYTALPANLLRFAIDSSPASIKVLVLDCCYSGRALGSTMTDEAEAIMDQTEIAGTCSLASAPRHLVSLYIEGEKHTVFSGELIKLLKEGLADGSPVLPVKNIYRQLCRRMQFRNLAKPKILNSDTVSEFALVRNRGYRPPERPSVPAESEEPRPLRTIAEADALIGRAGLILSPTSTAQAELRAAAVDERWPVLARLRFAWTLDAIGDSTRAMASLSILGADDEQQAIHRMNALTTAMHDDEAWTEHVDPAWKVDELVTGGSDNGDAVPERLWGAAMAMLLAAAGLPTPVRVEAVAQLAQLGHGDQARWIAQGMLRDPFPAPGLVGAVRRFLARGE